MTSSPSPAAPPGPPADPRPVDPSRIAVVAVNWKRAAETVACLDALRSAGVAGPTVYVVDDGSDDDSVATIRAARPDVTVVELAENRGTAGGRNAGIRAALDAGCDAVLLLDAAMDVDATTVPALVRALDDEPRAAAASSAVVEPDGRALLEGATALRFGDGLARRGVASPAVGPPIPVDVCGSPGMLVRATALRDVGLFDEDYFSELETADWCVRARRRGWRVLHQPASTVRRRAAFGPRPERAYLRARNAVRLVRTQGSRADLARFVAATLIALPLRLLAVAAQREDDLARGEWSWRRALAALRPARLPRALAAAHRERRTTDLIAHVRGVWDGLLGRPLPLHRLGLYGVRRLLPERVVVVVLNWNGAEDTIACVESLAKADLRGARVLVVDNGSRDGSVETIRRRLPEQWIVSLPRNEGYAGGNNAGMRAALDAGADAVLLLNNDTTVAPDFLTTLVQALNETESAAAVASAVMRMDVPELLDVAYLEVHLELHGVVRLQGVNALPSEGYETRRVVDVGTGCSLLVRSDALRRVGLLDEDFFAYHEEVDWCIRARAVGFDVVWEPLSRVFHRGSRSTHHLRKRPTLEQAPADEQLPNAAEINIPWNPVRTYLGARNSIRLIRKHATLREKLGFLGSTLFVIPLSLSATLMRREGRFRLNDWRYRDFLREWFVRRHATVAGWLDRGPAWWALGAVALLALWPVDLCRLPVALWREHRDGRTEEMEEHVRGLWDGVLGRALPLERLGLR